MATVGLKIISGNSNARLAKSICDYIGISPCRARIEKFSDGETQIELGESVRGADAFVIQSLAHPVNDHLMELLAIVDALKRASVKRVTAVMPYYGYARQDRKNKPRVPITARLLADLITAVGPFFSVPLAGARVGGIGSPRLRPSGVASMLRPTATWWAW